MRQRGNWLPGRSRKLYLTKEERRLAKAETSFIKAKLKDVAVDMKTPKEKFIEELLKKDGQ